MPYYRTYYVIPYYMSMLYYTKCYYTILITLLAGGFHHLEKYLVNGKDYISHILWKIKNV